MIPGDPATSLAARVEIVVAYLIGLCLLYVAAAGVCALLEPWVRRLNRWGEERWSR